MLRPVILHPALVVEVTEQQSPCGVAFTAISLTSRETVAQHREPPELYQQVLAVLKALHGHPFSMCLRLINTHTHTHTHTHLLPLCCGEGN